MFTGDRAYSKGLEVVGLCVTRKLREVGQHVASSSSGTWALRPAEDLLGVLSSHWGADGFAPFFPFLFIFISILCLWVSYLNACFPC